MAKTADSKPENFLTYSMTGFTSFETDFKGQRFRVEMKSLNHRYLEIKTRMPREFQTFDLDLRSAIQSAFSRGTFDFRFELSSHSGQQNSQAALPSTALHLNLATAAEYHQSLLALQKTLGLNDPIRTIDLALLPDVFQKAPHTEVSPQEAKTFVLQIAKLACDHLKKSRAEEGSKLIHALEKQTRLLQSQIQPLRELHKQAEQNQRAKLRDKIKLIFDTYPLPQNLTDSSTLLETRLAQELALLIDRADIEEELTRFSAHLEQLLTTLQTPSPIGRKLDFLLQELHREANTLGNKSNDLKLGEAALQLKLQLEQIREQGMNLE